MVLRATGGAARGASRPGRPHGGESGAQAVEFALVLPGVVLLVVLLMHTAVLGADLVTVHGLAREAARIAAVAGADAAPRRVAAAAAPREVEVDVSTSTTAPRALVTARVALRTRAFAPFGVVLWLPAEATMQVEHGG